MKRFKVFWFSVLQMLAGCAAFGAPTDHIRVWGEDENGDKQRSVSYLDELAALILGVDPGEIAFGDDESGLVGSDEARIDPTNRGVVLGVGDNDSTVLGGTDRFGTSLVVRLSDGTTTTLQVVIEGYGVEPFLGFTGYEGTIEDPESVDTGSILLRIHGSGYDADEDAAWAAGDLLLVATGPPDAENSVIPAEWVFTGDLTVQGDLTVLGDGGGGGGSVAETFAASPLDADLKGEIPDTKTFTIDDQDGTRISVADGGDTHINSLEQDLYIESDNGPRITAPDTGELILHMQSGNGVVVMDQNGVPSFLFGYDHRTYIQPSDNELTQVTATVPGTLWVGITPVTSSGTDLTTLLDQAFAAGAFVHNGDMVEVDFSCSYAAPTGAETESALQLLLDGAAESLTGGIEDGRTGTGFAQLQFVRVDDETLSLTVRCWSGVSFLDQEHWFFDILNTAYHANVLQPGTDLDEDAVEFVLKSECDSGSVTFNYARAVLWPAP